MVNELGGAESIQAGYTLDMKRPAATFSEEAETCAECIEAYPESTRAAHDASVIRGPGKFEGEHISTFHAYHVMLEGMADDQLESCWRVGNVIAFERSDGFVIGTVYDTAGEASDAFDKIAALCPECDCADDTALPGLASECECECH